MIVRLIGGLGNQMFQYAFGKSVSAVRNEEVSFSRPPYWRPYGLGAYPISVPITGETSSIYYEPGFTFDPNVYTAPRGVTFIGYWQTAKYFNEPMVRAFFKLRNQPSDKTKAIADDIQSAGEASVFIHARRGDYTQPGTNEYHGIPTMDYYNVAIEKIRVQHENAKFFAFSDEPEWCRANFPEFTIVDHNADTPHEDLWLMSQCQNAIMANSSFSWWGAWLNKTQQPRLVIAPQRWFLADVNTRDLLPEGWVAL